jgi:hypothetical protein
MTGASAHKAALGNRIVHGGNTGAQTRAISEGGCLTIVVTVGGPQWPGARVDRDHDHLLHEYMQASDE